MKKMYEESNIQDIADAIREKNGSIDTYKLSEMANAIREMGASNITEVEITSSITNGLALSNILFANTPTNHNRIAYLSKPKNNEYIDNQFLLISYIESGNICMRYRNGSFGVAYSDSSYDAYVTIGDIYSVIDLGEKLL